MFHQPGQQHYTFPQTGQQSLETLFDGLQLQTMPQSANFMPFGDSSHHCNMVSFGTPMSPWYPQIVNPHGLIIPPEGILPNGGLPWPEYNFTPQIPAPPLANLVPSPTICPTGWGRQEGFVDEHMPPFSLDEMQTTDFSHDIPVHVEEPYVRPCSSTGLVAPQMYDYFILSNDCYRGGPSRYLVNFQPFVYGLEDGTFLMERGNPSKKSHRVSIKETKKKTLKRLGGRD